MINCLVSVDINRTGHYSHGQKYWQWQFVSQSLLLQCNYDLIISETIIISQVLKAFIGKTIQYLQCWPFFTNLWNSLWHAGYHLLGQVLTEGEPFLPYYCLELITICGLLLVLLPFVDWPQVLYEIKIQGISWPRIQNVNVIVSKPLHYHTCLVT